MSYLKRLSLNFLSWKAWM